MCASTSALAMGADVKLYACTRIVLLAAASSFTTASVQPPLGEKIDLDGRQGLGLLALRGILGLAGGGEQEKDQDDREKAVFH